MNVLLVGHRGVGKSTLGAILAYELRMELVDVDAVIERATGTPVGDLVRSDERAFRALEVETVASALEGTDRVIVAGGGLEKIPPHAFVVWIHRDGWEMTAREERARLRPDLDWEAEVAWMVETREPRWARAAHLRYVVEVGRSAERAARDVATMVRWFAPDAANRSRRARVWVVPATPEELEGAVWLADSMDLGGVELRSDVFQTWPGPELGAVAALASLRGAHDGFLRHAADRAAVFDLDVESVGSIDVAELFGSRPRPLVLSSHPPRVDPSDVELLVRFAREIQLSHPDWAEHVVVKYAPTVQTVDEVGLAAALVEPLRRAGVRVTYLPQGERFAWIRPMLLEANATSYMAARHRFAGPAATPMDVQDWLPHLAGPAPRAWDALVGDPVETSQGAVWHRRAALEAGSAAGYVLVPTPDEAFDETLALLRDLGVRGVSVTSPHKRRVAFVRHDDGPAGELMDPETAARAATRGVPVTTGNTLRRTKRGWLATDTDEMGMSASLEALEARGIRPGTVALFGGGGVTPAVIRAIESSNWFLVLHVGAREGWPERAPHYVTLVVNAAGPGTDAATGAPRCDAWLDLHYTGVASPEDVDVHLAGDVFFDAQARAQRQFFEQSGEVDDGW